MPEGIIRGHVNPVGRTEEQLQAIYTAQQEYRSCLEKKEYEKASRIKERTFANYSVLFSPLSSTRAKLCVGLYDFCCIPDSEKTQAKETCEKYIKQRRQARRQISFSVNDSEQKAIALAALNFDCHEVSSFALQASLGVASLVHDEWLRIAGLNLNDLFYLLRDALNVDDLQLFTADEIRELGLTPEQSEQLGGMIAQKQAGLWGVKKPVSGGEQTA